MPMRSACMGRGSSAAAAPQLSSPPPLHTGRTVEDQIRDLVHFFVHKGLLLRTERKFKQPKPGRKLLVKFPKTIIHCAVSS